MIVDALMNDTWQADCLLAEFASCPHRMSTYRGATDAPRVHLRAGTPQAMATVRRCRFSVSGRLVPVVPGARLSIPLFWVHLRSAQAPLERLTQCVMAAARKSLTPDAGD